MDVFKAARRSLTRISKSPNAIALLCLACSIPYPGNTLATVRYEYVSGGVAGSPLTFRIYWEHGPNDGVCLNGNCSALLPVVPTTPYRIINNTRGNEVSITVPGNFSSHPGLNWGQVVNRVLAASGGGPTTHTISVPATWQNGDNVCVAGTWGWPAAETCSTSLPVSAPVTCTLSTPGIAVTHGDVALTDTNGSQATASARFQCTGNATVKIRAIASASNPSSTITVRGDGSITSRLAVNGADGATGVIAQVVANQAVDLSLTSTLASGQPTPGALDGNATLVLDIQ
jgi:hypothetical protein